MNKSEFFASLGAPFTNVRWSWGGVRFGLDGAVVLRVWQDEIVLHDKLSYVRVMRFDTSNKKAASPGYKERLHHVELIRRGRTCYMVMCTAKDPKAMPREIKEFNKKEIAVGGRLLQLNEGWWVELASWIPAQELI